MKINAAIAIISLVSILYGCGGGSGKKSTLDTNISTSSAALARELMFEFAASPLQPKSFNLKSTDPAQNNWFYPGDRISLVWDVDIFYSDGSIFTANEKYTYDADVYLSMDEQIEIDKDLKLFSIQCAVPGNSSYSCTDLASFQCIYAVDNLNNFSCTSIPLDKPLGIKDSVVDASAYLTKIPVKTNLLIKNCLREASKKCITKALPIELN
jgi:hypothetical protein